MHATTVRRGESDDDDDATDDSSSASPHGAFTLACASGDVCIEGEVRDNDVPTLETGVLELEEPLLLPASPIGLALLPGARSLGDGPSHGE